MDLDNTKHSPSDSPIGDVAYLSRSEHRVPTLAALTESPRSRAELCELTDVSSSTMRRTLDQFEDRIWVRKDGRQYAATRLGETVAAGVEELLVRVETERRLRDVWHWLPDEFGDLSVDTWSELTITTADPDLPYHPVNRFESLLRETTTVRFLRPEVALMDPCFDTLYRRLDDGVDVTLIDRPTCHAYFISTYPERCSEMLKRDNFTVLEHDDLPPYGTGLLDDRVAISCYERERGTVNAVIDTDSPAVREWAESLYERYRADARPLDPDVVAE
jgi:predicted transcriptional regulator